MQKFEEVKISLLEPNKGQIEGLPANPRFIKDENFEKLKKDIADYPELLEMRGLIVYPFNGRYVLIGGNMRYRAIKELGYKTAPCIIVPEDTPADKLQAYTILDNAPFGEWDWDMLANEWDAEDLDNWAVDVPEFSMDGDCDDLGENEREIKDLSDKLEMSYRLEVTLANESDQEQLYNKLTGEGYTCRILTL